MGSIPVTKIWQYIDRFSLPDWWEPVLLQTDAAVVSSMSKEMSRDAKSSKPKANEHTQRKGGA